MNEEKNLPTEVSTEENVEINTDPKKKLPLGALIGIIAGAVAVIAIVVVIILLSGNKCPGHVDADDDYPLNSELQSTLSTQRDLNRRQAGLITEQPQI